MKRLPRHVSEKPSHNCNTSKEGPINIRGVSSTKVCYFIYRRRNRSAGVANERARRQCGQAKSRTSTVEGSLNTLPTYIRSRRSSGAFSNVDNSATLHYPTEAHSQFADHLILLPKNKLKIRMADFGFLRTIPEDRSQIDSSVAASNPSGDENTGGRGGGGDDDDAESVRAVEAGREGGSVVSDAMATLAGGGGSGRDDSKKNSSSAARGGGTGGGRGGTGGDGDGQARRSGGSGYDDAGSNIGVLPGTSDVSPRRGGRRPPSGRRDVRHHHHHHSKHGLERVFCYWSRSKRKKTCLWLLVVLVITAFVLCVVLLTTTDDPNDASPSPVNNGGGGPSEVALTSPTAAPTTTATIAPETIEALDAILLTLTSAELLYPPSGFDDLGPDKNESSYTPTTQAQARQWMLEEDLRRDEVLADGPARVLQRYSLVVFFIATNRSDLLDGAAQECDWTGIHCQEPDTSLGGDGSGPTEIGGTGGDLDVVGGGSGSSGGYVLGDEDGTLQLVVRGIILPMSNLTGTLPSELRALTSLGELHIPDNNVAGVIPPEWFVLVPPPSTGETPVVVNDTTTNSSLFATLPPGTGTQVPISAAVQEEVPEPGLYSLFWLDASRNQLSGSIPPGLWSLPYLRFVYLNENDLSGPLETLTTTITAGEESTATASPTDGSAIPIDSSSDSNLVLSSLLEDVRLQDNRLSGTIPSWLLSRPTLRAVVANNNEFIGSLPQDESVLQQAISLSVLDLSNNTLTGPLPSNLFTSDPAYSTLHFLYLENNMFSGPLPNGDGDAVVLMDVWLYSNNLQGTIPAGFAQGWNNLTELLLHGNPLLIGELELPEEAAAPTLAPVAVGTTPTNTTLPPGTTATPVPATCESTWPMLERMTADCKAVTGETLSFADVVCPCCTECY
jgi:hypothetical protein